MPSPRKASNGSSQRRTGEHLAVSFVAPGNYVLQAQRVRAVAHMKRGSSLRNSKFSLRKSWNLWKRTKVFMNFSQICQIKDFKILCVHGFEVECFVWGNPGKNCWCCCCYYYYYSTSYEMQTNFYFK